MENYQLGISEAISTGWEYAKKYGLLIAVIYLVVSMVSSGLQSITGSSVNLDVYREMGESIGRGDWEDVGRYAERLNGGLGSSFGTWIGYLVTIVVNAALYNLALGLMSGRFTEVTFDAFKLPAQTYLKVVAVELLTGIAIFISVLFCVVPFFFVAPRLVLAPVYQVQNPEAGVFDSIKASWDMTTGNTFSMLGLGISTFGINILGFFCCCIGFYFTQTIELFALIAAFYQLGGGAVANISASADGYNTDGYSKTE